MKLDSHKNLKSSKLEDQLITLFVVVSHQTFMVGSKTISWIKQQTSLDYY